MKYDKNIAGFEKSKSTHYSTKVTATKGERIAIWTSFVFVFALVFFSIFFLKNLVTMFITIGVGIIILFAIMFFCVFRPLHKEERQKNAFVTKATINQSYNNVTGKVNDNSKIEETENNIKKGKM